MSALHPHATVIDAAVLPHDGEHRVLRLHVAGTHVDFLLPTLVAAKLARQLLPDACPLVNQSTCAGLPKTSATPA